MCMDGYRSLYFINGSRQFCRSKAVIVSFHWRLAFPLLIGRITDFHNMALFLCPDPRKLKFSKHSPTDIPIPKGAVPLRQNLAETIKEGHYMLFRYGITGLIYEYTWIPRIIDSSWLLQTRGLGHSKTFGRDSLRTIMIGEAVLHHKLVLLLRAVLVRVVPLV